MKTEVKEQKAVKSEGQETKGPGCWQNSKDRPAMMVKDQDTSLAAQGFNTTMGLKGPTAQFKAAT